MNGTPQKNDRAYCSNYNNGGILLVAQAGKILLKIIAHRVSEYFQRADILPD